MARRGLSTVLGVAVLSTGATVVLLWPLVSHLDSVLTNQLDGAHYVWVLEGGRQALARSPGAWFEGNIFFPLEATRALAEHCLGYQLFYAPLAALMGSPVAATNLVSLLSFPLSAVAMFCLARAMVGDGEAALVAGTMFAFAPLRMAQLEHMHLLGFFWTPCALYCAWLWLRRGARRFFWGAIIAVVLQIASGWYLGYFAVISVGAMIATALASRALPKPRVGDVLLAALVVVPFLMWMAWPYLRVAAEFKQQQSPIETIQDISADAVYSYASVDQDAWLYGRWLGRFPMGDFGAEKHLFPGMLCIVLAAVSLWTTGLRSPPLAVRCAHVLVLVGVVFSLGPYLTVAGHHTAVPLPYLIPYWLIPGFASMRAVARFAFVAHVGVVLLAAHGLTVLLARVVGARRTWRHVLIAALFVAVLIEGSRGLRPATIQTPDTLPEYVEWLRGRGAGVLLEIPFGEEDHVQHLIRQAGAMYRSLFHRHALANGYASFIPPQAHELMEQARRLPEARALHYMRQWGITHLVVHPEARSYRTLSDGLLDDEQVRERVVFGDGVLILALREPEPPAGTLRLALKPRVLRRVRRAGMLRIAFANDGPGYWRSSGRRTPLRYRWRGGSGEVLLERITTVRPPVVLAPGEVRYRSAAIAAPPRGRHPQTFEMEYDGTLETTPARPTPHDGKVTRLTS